MTTATHTRSFVVWLWEWTKSIVVALVVWFFLRTFLVEAFRIPSGSMIRITGGLIGVAALGIALSIELASLKNA